MNRCRANAALLRLGVIFVAAAVGSVTGTFAQGPENADFVDLSGGWRFKIGDDESWSSPGFDDSRWERIAVGKSWESQGHADYDGYAWYRIRCPVLMGIGLQDDVCPAATIFAVYNRIEAAKEYHVYPYAKHSVGPSHGRMQSAWIHRHFLQGSGESTKRQTEPVELP
jgi:pimeloyl-ACP methyl ester carboxylesterase